MFCSSACQFAPAFSSFGFLSVQQQFDPDTWEFSADKCEKGTDR